MKLHELTCPKCQGSLDIKIDDRKYIHCPYCGQMFSVDNGKREYTINKNININKNITHTQRNINDAEIIKARNEATETKICVFLLIIFVGLIIFGFIYIVRNGSIETEDSAMETGKISAGSYSDYIDTDYEAVVEQFELLGFTNITTIDLKDSGFALWENGKVESISIGGDSHFGRNDYFYPDTIIIIKYH